MKNMSKVPKGPKASKIAAELAEESKQWYGWSVLGGDWYTGTVEQLTAIGVMVPTPCLSIQMEREAAKVDA